MEQYNSIAGSVFCSFITNLPDIYKVDTSPLEIQTSSTNIDLSDLISQMTDIEDQKFDFLINGEFLRGNLKSHILKFLIQTETVLQIQYFLSIKPPQLEKEIPEDDWVSGISTQDNIIVSSLFSGFISVYKNNKKIISQQIAQKSLKTVKIVENKLYTGGLNNSISVLTLNKNQLENQIQLDGPSMSIESLDVNPIDNQFICAGGYDQKLYIWKNQEIQENSSKEKVKKRIKTEMKSIQPILETKIHNDSINCVCWPAVDTIITGGSDHLIKMYDVNKKIESINFQLRDSVCSSIDAKGDMILNGSENGLIKLWDIRQKDRNCQQTFKSHNVWVSQIKFHQKTDNLFASSSYDQSIKIWDLRTSYPLFTLKAGNKQFALEWKDDDYLLSGGQDQKISINKFQQ